MKYMGSKNRIAKFILPIVLKDRKPEQYYVEPFGGGMNMIQHVCGNRIVNEINPYVIAMFEALVRGWEPPKNISKEDYFKIKNDTQAPEYLKGYVGFNCSYSGKWFGGYAGVTKTKQGIRDYQEEAYRNIKEQVPKLIGIVPYCGDYRNFPIPENSIIYCDPPYEGATSYKDKFNHSEFWEWCRKKKFEGHQIFIS